jgi:hypothetical protein
MIKPAKAGFFMPGVRAWLHNACMHRDKAANRNPAFRRGFCICIQ